MYIPIKKSYDNLYCNLIIVIKGCDTQYNMPLSFSINLSMRNASHVYRLGLCSLKNDYPRYTENS